MSSPCPKRTARRAGRALIGIVLLGLMISIARTEEIGHVVAVVDGDTLKVSLDGDVETVRLIGVDTPETVHPSKPVEYFGKEASEFLKHLVLNRTVLLTKDAETANRDKYGRLLRYVYLDDGSLVNALIIQRGFGHAYTRFPFTRMEEFRSYERRAREAGEGLWGGS